MAEIVTVTFNYTGSQQTWVVPQGVTRITIDCYGAQGGYYTRSSSSSSPGLGGRARATFEVTPGETLYIYVGQSGEGQYRQTFGGGGAGGWRDGPFLSGGGASDVRRGGNSLNHRIIVAGGGGGGGASDDHNQVGGHGGGSSGGDGLVDGSFYPHWCGRGATQSAGGAGATGNIGVAPGKNGSFGIGGNGSDFSGGGGGGWYGGGSGGETVNYFTGGPGGGGSGYIHPSGIDPLFQTGVRSGHGLVTITYEVGPKIYVSIGGQIKESEKIWARVNGQLKEVERIWTKVNGQLKEV